MKLFGFNIVRLNKKQSSTTNAAGDKKRATKAIRKTARREVSYQLSELKSAISLAKNPETPDRNKLIQIFYYIMRDGHLKSQIKQAKLKVLSEPWLLYKDGTADVEMTKNMHQKWFNKIIEYILESEFWAYSVIEADEIDPKTFKIGKVKLIEREYVSIEKKWILLDGTINGSYLPYEEIKNDIDLIEFGNSDELGDLLECAYNILWKYYSRSDWSRANEKVGSPILSVVVDSNNEDDLDDAEKRAANFGSDGYFVGQKGDEINLIERKSDNFHLTFKDKIALCNEEVSKIINGQTGTSDMKAFVGAAEVHERVMEDFTIARLQLVVDEVKENLFPYLIAKGFPLEGYEFNYPYLIRLKERKINGVDAQAKKAEEVENNNENPK